ncbi:hypothetical protein HU200_028757 [Digitaria exilis]|uniref:Uncharacterized protein n=1 Tax=Digitaria exilis TaxID=1010633 RepID=A0A835BVR4_9POAL|nr:hypothetical protein HU200_028757 [Digitaria exilis]
MTEGLVLKKPGLATLIKITAPALAATQGLMSGSGSLGPTHQLLSPRQRWLASSQPNMPQAHTISSHECSLSPFALTDAIEVHRQRRRSDRLASRRWSTAAGCFEDSATFCSPTHPSLSSSPPESSTDAWFVRLDRRLGFGLGPKIGDETERTAATAMDYTNAMPDAAGPDAWTNVAPIWAFTEDDYRQWSVDSRNAYSRGIQIL